MINRYLLFAGASYHPMGGWEDLIGHYNTLSEVREAIKGFDYSDWYQVIDTATGLEISADAPD